MDTQNQGAAPDFAEIETKVAGIAESVKGLAGIVGRLDKIEAKMQRPGAATVSADERAEIEGKAFRSYLRHGAAAPAEELKALSVSSDPQGGFLAPAELSTEFVRNLVQLSPMRSVASIRQTGAPSVIYPTRTTITNAAWHGETATRTGSEPAFGQREIVARQLSTFVDVSVQLLADSGGQADQEVRLALAEDFAAKEGKAFVDGVGTVDPEGIWTAAGVAEIPVGYTALPAISVLAEKIHALPAAFRDRGVFLMNGKTLGALRGDTSIVTPWPIWGNDPAKPFVETLFGFKVVEIPDAPDPTNGASPIIFGDVEAAYRIVDRTAMSILVDPYSQAVNGLVRIHATRRVGGGVINPAAIIKLKLSAS